MTLFSRIIAFVVLALWLPATVLCVARCSSLGGDDLCCPKDSDHQPVAPAKVNCVLSSAVAKLDDSRRIHFEFPSVCLISSTPTLSLPQTQWQIPVSHGRDFLVVPWQFVQRTALSPRAPSGLS